MSNANFDSSVGENIQSLRKARGLSQAELAEQLVRYTGTNYHQQTVLRIEKGDRPLKLSEAMTLAKVFGVPPTALWRVSEIDTLVGSWTQRVEELEHRKDVAEVELAAINEEYASTVRLASSFLHLQEYIENGDPKALPAALEEIASAADAINDATPIRNRFRLTDLLREIGVTSETIETAAAQANSETPAKEVIAYILRHHQFDKGDEDQ